MLGIIACLSYLENKSPRTTRPWQLGCTHLPIWHAFTRARRWYRLERTRAHKYNSKNVHEEISGDLCTLRQKKSSNCGTKSGTSDRETSSYYAACCRLNTFLFPTRTNRKKKEYAHFPKRRAKYTRRVQILLQSNVKMIHILIHSGVNSDSSEFNIYGLRLLPKAKKIAKMEAMVRINVENVLEISE